MVLDLFPYDAKEWEELGAFDYVSSCCLAWIDYQSNKELMSATCTYEGYAPPHWIYCSDCLKPLKQWSDIESLEQQKRLGALYGSQRYNAEKNRIEIVNQTWTGTTITIS